VIWPFTGQGASVPIITKAGIPIIAVSGSSSEELTTPGVFILTGGYIATLGAYAQDAKDRGYKHFSMVVIDVPAATQAAQALGGQVFKKAGVAFDVITAAPGTPDLSPQLQEAVSNGADAIGVTGDVTFCTSFLKAYQTLGLDVAKYIIATCTDQSVVKALPDALDGAIMAGATSSTDSTDTKVYAAMLEKYAKGKGIDPDPAKSSGVAAGVSAVVDFVNGMKGLTGDPTPAAITQQIKTVKGDIFLSGGLTFDCSSKPIPILANICSAELQVGTVDENGVVQDPKPIDPAPLFAS
jgi:branched-chain amino acid transport system substrate-binding protein